MLKSWFVTSCWWTAIVRVWARSYCEEVTISLQQKYWMVATLFQQFPSGSQKFVMEPQSEQESNRKPISQRILAGTTLNSRVWKISVTEAYNVLDKSKTGYLPLSHKFFSPSFFFSTPHWLPHLKQVHLLFFNRSVRERSLHILVVQTFSLFFLAKLSLQFSSSPPLWSLSSQLLKVSLEAQERRRTPWTLEVYTIHVLTWIMIWIE